MYIQPLDCFLGLERRVPSRADLEIPRGFTASTDTDFLDGVWLRGFAEFRLRFKGLRYWVLGTGYTALGFANMPYSTCSLRRRYLSLFCLLRL